MISVKIVIIIPTLNASSYLSQTLSSFNSQTLFTQKIIIDSSSTDYTQQLALEAGCTLEVIPRSEFDHGGTRNQAARLARGDIFVFLTQDVLPQDQHFIENLVRPIINGTASASYARQVAAPSASPLERFFRAYRFPSVSSLKRAEVGQSLSVQDVQFSNAASAISNTAFWEIGGFTEGVILGEDVMLASKLLKAGHTIAYQADAVVWHTHDYGLMQQFKRYFDIGACYSRAGDALGGSKAGGEGVKLARAQFAFLLNERAYTWMPRAVLELGAKWLGYRLGYIERLLPLWLKHRVSLQPGFWRDGR
jgi:rhamnosyltransferase